MTRTIDFPDDLMDALKQLSDDEHRSVNATLIVAAKEYVERRSVRQRAVELGHKVVEMDRELLDRLAK